MKDKFSKFTLIELLTVVAIILILAAILFPTLYGAKWIARFQLCKVNLKSINGGLASYSQDYSRWYPDGRATSGPIGMHSFVGEGRYMQCFALTNNWHHFNTWAKYYNPQVQWSKNRNPDGTRISRSVDDYRIFHVSSAMMQCPQGIYDAKWDTYYDSGAFTHCGGKATYSMYSNLYHGQSPGAKRRYFDSNGDECDKYDPDKVSSGYFFSLPHRVLRRLGDQAVFATFQGKGAKDYRFEILSSDIANRSDGVDGRHAVSNHTWGGEKIWPNTTSYAHSSWGPLYYKNPTGRTSINYGMCDGRIVEKSVANAKVFENEYSMAISAEVGAGGSYMWPDDMGAPPDGI